ncbi:MAG: leucine-rich repeat domain-containing protein [bacterium]|nr:leucine-rich repeat domain-containing protein [bacterium]
MKSISIKRLLLMIFLLFIPVIVFASSGNSDFSLGIALGMEVFMSGHMSVFVFIPLSKMISKENSKKTFWTLFAIRAGILIFCDFFITPYIAIVDFIAVFIGAFIIVPICAAVTKTKIYGTSNQDLNTTSLQNQINGIELKCAKCNTVLNITDKICPSCGEPFDGNNVIVSENANAVVQIPPKNIVLPTNFDEMYSFTEDKMLEEFINRKLAKVGIDKSSKLIPSDILKRKKILNIVFSILTFVFITLIFFHFPIYTYIVGLVILFIFFRVTRKYDLIKYMKKQLKARPGEKISNIVMNVKNTFVIDNSKDIFIISLLMAVILPLIIFSSPRILYEKVDDGYAVRYYAFGLTNFKTVTIPETYKNEKVVSLRGNTFSNMPFLESVNLPDTITEIRGQAFKNCYKLAEVNIPKKLEYLGGGAFYNAKSIKRIELPDTLTYLGGESFYGAKSLEYIKLSNNLSEIRGDSFEYCTSLKSIIIPDNVTRIGGHAFYGDSSLSEVSISENSKLSEIGSSAFRQCSSLYYITIPYGTYVNERAFKESPTTVNRFDYESYDNNFSIIDDSNNSNKDEWLEDYIELENKSKHIIEDYYVYNSDETIVFDKYDMIISVSRESKNDEINFAVKVTTKLYGSTIINYNNTFRYGENYVYWNNFKIMFVENDDSTELKIIVQNIDDLS